MSQTELSYVSDKTAIVQIVVSNQRAKSFDLEFDPEGTLTDSTWTLEKSDIYLAARSTNQEFYSSRFPTAGATISGSGLKEILHRLARTFEDPSSLAQIPELCNLFPLQSDKAEEIIHRYCRLGQLRQRDLPRKKSMAEIQLVV
jgi:hypothetical protein